MNGDSDKYIYIYIYVCVCVYIYIYIVGLTYEWRLGQGCSTTWNFGN